MRRLILRSFQSPGDVVMLTAAVRDLHRACPAQFQTDVRTSADALWENNPHLTPLVEGEPGVETLDMHYPLVHHSNQRPYHFLHGYAQYLEQRLGVRIPVTRFAGDIHLSDDEKNSPPPGRDAGVPDRYWIIVAGGKFDFTAKWWNPARFQEVVNHFRDRIAFVQCGEAGHWHPRLSGVVNRVGRTTLREFVRLMYHAEGVLCPVTFAMHLAAAVETRPGRPPHRPCVVVAGGREPPHWEAYPHHQFISTVGALACCADGGCWRSRCQLVGDGDAKDRRNVCELPVEIAPNLRIPRCMELITAEDVIRRIEYYLDGGIFGRGTGSTRSTGGPPVAQREPSSELAIARNSRARSCQLRPRGDAHGERHGARAAASSATSTPSLIPSETQPMPSVLIQFRHGLGDAVQLTSVLKHLRHYYPDHAFDVAARVGKHSAFHGLARNVYVLERDELPAGYTHAFDLAWPECATCYANSPSTKAERCLSEVFRLTPIADLCRYTIHRSPRATDLARRYLERICRGGPGENSRFPVVLIHYEGNTSGREKNLPRDVVGRLCEDILAAGSIPVILDWDERSPLPDGRRIHNPHVDLELWGGTGTGDAEVLAALIELSSLMIGVDSGPLHVAGACSTPALGVWTRHHPLHFFGLAENVVHLVPESHERLLRGDPAAGSAYFERAYRFETYADLEQSLRAAVGARLGDASGALVHTRGFWIRSDNAQQDLVVVKDIAEDDSYRVDELPMPETIVVDVGAHIGCFTKRLHERNPLARIIAVECCPENLSALRRNVGHFATVEPAAVTYERDVALLNAVFPNCETTGGSTLVRRAELERRVAAGEFECNPHAPRAEPAGWSSPTGDDPASASPKSRHAERAEYIEATSADRAQYWPDFRPITTLTLEDLLARHGLERIDVLKLDCEGSEFSILEQTTLLDRIGVIVGEYHGKARFEELVRRRFASWRFEILRDGELGTFRLTNLRSGPRPAQAAAIGFDELDEPAEALPVVRMRVRPADPCQCSGPGWCDRYGCHLGASLFEKCQRGEFPLQLAERRSATRTAAKVAPPRECVHRGEAQREVTCPSCAGHVRLKVYECDVHTECTLARSVAGLACCTGCPDYEAAA